MEKETLVQKIKEASGNSSDEIIAKVKELAAVDIKIKSACDEIESIEQELCDKHNELAEQINALINKVASGEEEPPEKKKTSTGKVKIEVRVVKAPAFNPALFALMNFLLN